MSDELKQLLEKTGQILTRLNELVPRTVEIDWSEQYAATWSFEGRRSQFRPVENLDPISLEDLLEIDRQKDALVENTAQFCRRYPANNVLLWGARGTGKSSLIHAVLNEFVEHGLRVVEVDKRSLSDIAMLATELQDKPFRFLVVCDDLSFDVADTGYKELKSALEGTVFATVENVLVYVTSNRRHLITELMEDNQSLQKRDLHGAEAIEEKISLSDRFGLWLSFHPFDQSQYLRVVRHWLNFYARKHSCALDWDSEIRKEALQWALNRGVRSGRTANHFGRFWIGSKLLHGSSDGERDLS